MQIQKIKVHEVMTCNVEDDVSEIAAKLKEKNERRVFVTDNQGVLKGIITTTDLVYKVLPNCSFDMKAKDVMVREVKSVDIKEDLEKALEIMNGLETFVCPVTEKGKILGIVSYPEIVDYVLASAKK